MPASEPRIFGVMVYVTVSIFVDVLTMASVISNPAFIEALVSVVVKAETPALLATPARSYLTTPAPLGIMVEDKSIVVAPTLSHYLQDSRIHSPKNPSSDFHTPSYSRAKVYVLYLFRCSNNSCVKSESRHVEIQRF